MSAAALEETAYGVVKRLEFAIAALEPLGPASVLDVGCGTGALLTAPLARRCPRAHLHGIDPDPGSLRFAREQHDLANLTFGAPDDLPADARFDLVIASEVLEHVEDPLAFLAFLRSRLRPQGRLLLTVPNGYGPFEWMALVEAVLELSGAFAVLRRAKRRLLGGAATRPSPAAGGAADTLAVSPHLNFFSYRSLLALLREAGFAVERYRARTFLCGFVWGAYVVTSDAAIRWNASIADRLPPPAVSDWMLLAAPNGAPLRTSGYRRGAAGGLRRRLYERRWGIR